MKSLFIALSVQIDQSLVSVQMLTLAEQRTGLFAGKQALLPVHFYTQSGCVCVRERERERERLYVCVCEKHIKTERQRQRYRVTEIGYINKWS